MYRLFLLVILTACAPMLTLTDQLRRDPAAAVNFLGNVFDGALFAARAGFEIWASANPGAAEQARVQFNSITADVSRGVRLGQSLAGVVTADNADRRFDAARTSMTNLNAFLAGLAPAPGGASSPEMQEALAATAGAAAAHVR